MKLASLPSEDVVDYMPGSVKSQPSGLYLFDIFFLL
jgi:hypothetical protein